MGVESPVGHQAVYLEPNGGEKIKSGLYFYRSDEGEIPFDTSKSRVLKLGYHEFSTLDDFSNALIYACQRLSDRELIQPPPYPEKDNGKIIVWTKLCSRIPSVFGINKDDAKEIIFSLASTRSSLVK